MVETRLNLQLFTEGPAAPAGGEAAGSTAEATATETTFQAGDTLPDGTKIASPRVAAAMEKQMKRHPELRAKYRGGAAPQTPVAAAQQAAGAQQADAQAAQAQQTDPATDLQNRWDAAKKGEFAELYGKDVQAAIQDRFKNQKSNQEELDKLEPMLKVLRDRAGVESNDDLIRQVMDDDSLYEEDANAAGMTVEAYKEHLKLVQERDQYAQEHREQVMREQLNQHYRKLVDQSQELKQQYPNFNLDKELQDERFRRMTAPDIGMSVKDAFYAIHHDELAPQMMAYGMQRAKQQMAQTIQANGNRPREGGMGNIGNNPTPGTKIDPRNMSRQERDALRKRIHETGESFSFG